MLLRRNFRKFFWNNFSAIVQKLKGNLRTLKKYRKHFAQIPKENTFWRKICRIFAAIFGGIRNFGNIWAAFENLSRGASKLNSALVRGAFKFEFMDFFVVNMSRFSNKVKAIIKTYSSCFRFTIFRFVASQSQKFPNAFLILRLYIFHQTNFVDGWGGEGGELEDDG